MKNRYVVALRGKDIDSFLVRPDAGRPIILLYGPDAGLVRERADALRYRGRADLAPGLDQADAERLAALETGAHHVHVARLEHLERQARAGHQHRM